MSLSHQLTKYSEQLKIPLSTAQSEIVANKLKDFFTEGCIPTGITALDLDLKGGLPRGLVTILGTSYKSTILQSLAYNAMRFNSTLKVLHVNLCENYIAERYLAAFYDSSFREVLLEKTTQEKEELLKPLRSKLTLQNKSGFEETIETLINYVKQEVTNNQIDLVVIDDVEVIMSEYKHLSKQETVARVFQGLSELALALNICILVSACAKGPQDGGLIQTTDAKWAYETMRQSKVVISINQDDSLISEQCLSLNLCKNLQGERNKLYKIKMDFIHCKIKNDIDPNIIFIASLKRIFADLGLDVKITKIYELCSKLSNFKNWNIAKSKGVNLYKMFNNYFSNKNTNKVDLKNFLKDYENKIKNNAFKGLMTYGIKEDGYYLTCNPKDSPGSLFVGGMGSGSSSAAFFTALTHKLTNSEDSLYFFVDLLKEAWQFQSLWKPSVAHNKTDATAVIKSEEKLVQLINFLYLELNARKKALTSGSHLNLTEYNNKNENLAEVHIFMENFHSIPRASLIRYSLNENTIDSTAWKLKTLYRTGHNYGIYFNNFSQRAALEDVPMSLKPGISNMFCFHMNNNSSDTAAINFKHASEILIGQRGRCAYAEGFLQFPFVSDVEAEALIKKYVKQLKAGLLTSTIAETQRMFK